MALITCPECGKQISDKATCCIHCGYPLSNYKYEGNTHFLILSMPGRNRAECTKLIRELRKVSLNEGLQICNSNKEEIILADNDLSKIENAKRQFESMGCTMRIVSANSETEVQLNLKPVTCPKCGSPSIATSARGVNLTMGLIGASKTVNRCQNCGYTWSPKK